MRPPAKAAPLSEGAEPAPREVVRHPRLDEAMERYARGDATAFAILHSELGPRLLRFLLRLSGSGARAADLCQETFLRIHRARGSFQVGGSVVPWSMTIARNVFHDDLRRRRLVFSRRGVDDEELQAVVSEEGTGEEHALARETADLLRATLAALPVAHREAFILLRYEGVSVAEAAEIVEATPAAVKLRAFRAYEAIREALRKREGT